jgi:hypothetical protein
VTAQDGSNRAPNHPFYNDTGLAVVFAVNGTELTKVADASIGKWNQGIARSHDGKTLLAQNMVEKSLSVPPSTARPSRSRARSRSTADRRVCTPQGR